MEKDLVSLDPLPKAKDNNPKEKPTKKGKSKGKGKDKGKSKGKGGKKQGKKGSKRFTAIGALPFLAAVSAMIPAPVSGAIMYDVNQSKHHH